MRDLVDIGPRVSGTPGNQKTRDYIVKTLGALGIKAVEQPFEAKTPLGVVRMANIVATLPGTRPERIILGSHFDTKLFREFRFVGASDGGSSTAALLELARTLHGRPRPFTIELLFLDGEEAVVEWSDDRFDLRQPLLRRAGAEIGHARPHQGVHPARHDRRPQSQHPARVELDALADRRHLGAARRVGHGRHFLAESTPIEDDHLPFLHAGVASVDIIDLDYPAWHTADDTLDAVSARSLQVVGDVVLAALPDIEQILVKK